MILYNLFIINVIIIIIMDKVRDLFSKLLSAEPLDYFEWGMKWIPPFLSCLVLAKSFILMMIMNHLMMISSEINLAVDRLTVYKLLMEHFFIREVCDNHLLNKIDSRKTSTRASTKNSRKGLEWNIILLQSSFVLPKVRWSLSKRGVGERKNFAFFIDQKVIEN